MTLEMKTIKNNFFVKALIFIFFFLFMKELVYLLIEDYFIIRFRFTNLDQGLYYEIFMSLFVITQIFVYHFFVNIYKNVKIFWRVLFLVISVVSAFYINSILFYINSILFYMFSEEFAYNYIKYFLITWTILFVILYWILYKISVIRYSNRE